MYSPCMINHAQHKNNTGKRRGGVRVNKRFKVEAYLESQSQVELLDKAAAMRHQSRSTFLGVSGVAEAERVVNVSSTNRKGCAQ